MFEWASFEGWRDECCNIVRIGSIEFDSLVGFPRLVGNQLDLITTLYLKLSLLIGCWILHAGSCACMGSCFGGIAKNEEDRNNDSAISIRTSSGMTFP